MEKNMTDQAAPERITVARMIGTGRRDVVGSKRTMSMGYVDATEYIRADLAAPSAPAGVEGLVDYDAGLLNDWGGGNTKWWMDYLRAEIGRANDFWRDQSAATLTALQAENERLAKECADAWDKCEERRLQAEKAEAAIKSASAILGPETYLAKPSEHNDDEQELLDRDSACNQLETARDAIRAAHAKLKGDV